MMRAASYPLFQLKFNSFHPSLARPSFRSRLHGLQGQKGHDLSLYCIDNSPSGTSNLNQAKCIKGYTFPCRPNFMYVRTNITAKQATTTFVSLFRQDISIERSALRVSLIVHNVLVVTVAWTLALSPTASLFGRRRRRRWRRHFENQLRSSLSSRSTFAVVANDDFLCSLWEPTTSQATKDSIYYMYMHKEIFVIACHAVHVVLV